MAKTKRPGAIVIDTARFDVVEFTVAGTGTFPLDMLRYDRCWAKTQEDTTILRSTAYKPSKHELTVTLQSIGTAAPTIDRWESYGWSVVTATS
jgi:hypothetical protein